MKNIFSGITGRATEAETPVTSDTTATAETSSAITPETSVAPTSEAVQSTETSRETTATTSIAPTEQISETSESVSAPVQIATSQCPAAPQPPTCPQGQALTSNTDRNGCVVGFQCTQSAMTLEATRQTATSSGEPISAQQTQCPADEQQRQIKDDCYKQGGTPIPFTQNGCVFYNCQSQQPSGQPRQQSACSSEQNAQIKQDCSQKGGNPISFEDPPGSGCIRYNCQFQQQVTQYNPLSEQACPNERDISMSLEKCKSLGGTPSVSFSGSCKVPQCIQKQSNRPPCPEDFDPSIKQRITEECRQQGGQTYASFDPQGCTITVCGGRQGIRPGQAGPGRPGSFQQPGQQLQTGAANAGICSGAPPVQAVTSCQQQGGQLVTQTDENGCINNAQCITRGDITDTYVEPVSKVPDTTVLLDVAFSMEQLKMKLDQMSRQTNDISAYYRSVGSTDAQKYNRVSQMFQAAVGKVSEIQMELRGKLEDLSTDDITKIKSDVRYVKDVMLKDALYLMLTNDNSDIQSISAEASGTQVSENDCGSDGYCFDQAVRICKPIRFKPEANAPDITIVGLQGNACIVKMSYARGQDVSTAECKLTDYARGFALKSPQDMAKYCTGSLVEMAKTISSQSSRQDVSPQPAQKQGVFKQPLAQQVDQEVTR
ncbi:hypothetical protein EPN87_02095 [archaeon]|nr:MAG: hypothetical protein EPN87_02095 [archaeon]